MAGFLTIRLGTFMPCFVIALWIHVRSVVVASSVIVSQASKKPSYLSALFVLSRYVTTTQPLFSVSSALSKFISATQASSITSLLTSWSVIPSVPRSIFCAMTVRYKVNFVIYLSHLNTGRYSYSYSFFATAHLKWYCTIVVSLYFEMVIPNWYIWYRAIYLYLLCNRTR